MALRVSLALAVPVLIVLLFAALLFAASSPALDNVVPHVISVANVKDAGDDDEVRLNGKIRREQQRLAEEEERSGGSRQEGGGKKSRLPKPSIEENARSLLATAPSQGLTDLLLTYDASGTIPVAPFDTSRRPDTSRYVKEAAQVAERMRASWLQNQDGAALRRQRRAAVKGDHSNKEKEGGGKSSGSNRNSSNGGGEGSFNPERPFRFHVYQIPDTYIHGALGLLAERWPTSFCNRHKKKTNYTNLDWRHAHSLFTADILISKYLQYHPSHTLDPAEADVFIIPMMTHAYNCAGTMFYAIDILSWVTQFPYYKLYGGHDHYFFWWRWGMHYKSVERLWKRVVRHFPNANIISFDFLELMGRNEWQDFSLALKPKFLQAQHWIVMPYPDFSPDLAVPRALPAVLMPEGSSASSAVVAASAAVYEERKVFFYFAGTSTIGGIRRWIKRNCETHEKMRRESIGSTSNGGNDKAGGASKNTATSAEVNSGGGDQGNICFYEDFAASVIDAARLGIPSGYPAMMKNTLFCGHAAGDALSSRRPTSAVLAGCIPVLICDLCLYAFEDTLDYSTFSVFVSEEDVLEGRLMAVLEAISPEAIRRMQQNLARVRHRFVYNISGPPSEGDALDSMVGQLAVRGRVLRSYRRWWAANHALPSDGYAYPKDPPPVKRYLRKGVSSAEEERNFNNI